MLCKRSAEFSTKDLTTALLHTKMYAEIFCRGQRLPASVKLWLFFAEEILQRIPDRQKSLTEETQQPQI